MRFMDFANEYTHGFLFAKSDFIYINACTPKKYSFIIQGPYRISKFITPNFYDYKTDIVKLFLRMTIQALQLNTCNNHFTIF